MNNLQKYHNKIKLINNRIVLGHESILDFNKGFIHALLATKNINRKEYNALIKVHVENPEYGFSHIPRYNIENGKLIDFYESSC